MGTPIRLIVGLGNPGSQYDKTRHNAGFWFVDELARRYSGKFAVEKRFSGEACKLQVGSATVWLLKPMTFMNRSGLAVKQLAQFYQIPVEQILVAHDELDIDAGDVRLKQAGGHGGHNGLRDCHAHLGADYWRLRLGVGHPGDRSKVVDYVLSRPSLDDEIVISRAIDKAADQIELILQGDMQKAMNALHTK
ncbi:aminoacyl-tRNA hydrolase [Thiothrix litoralis]|uniref:Peptidyl-tRNA hydrolase n=1 Tax=Thiothrix litoralis TaxID=2891210 RepID=A0ABX7WTF6_9GAMM|nr:aminoacyl-tRNA hydrolase [Thiothrix litoralis]QTR46792.1 aminoacyl-tRNA hydrolase [Thiothrix litoralis]